MFMNVFKSFFLFTSIVTTALWVVALVCQIRATVEFGRLSVGVLWFGLVTQLVVNLGGIYTLADAHSAYLYRSTISAFAVLSCALGGIGINDTLSSHLTLFQMLSSAWLIMVILDLLWIVYFTADSRSGVWRIMHEEEPAPPPGLEDESFAPMPHASPAQHIPATPPYSSSKRSGAGSALSHARSPSEATATATNDNEFRPPHPPFGTVNTATNMTGTDIRRLTPPLSSDPGSAFTEETESGLGSEVSYTQRARALYDYSTPGSTSNDHSASSDFNQLSFRKGDVLEVMPLDKKWWPARTRDGRRGIAPSNYLTLISEPPRRKLKKINERS
ncbi:Transmembrane osmosensor [Marasmius crinis-equi]|uniref:Transmembrane osmosensor n=1 Tax=Marasmius crinis-equi TaxID=585013 RepID=A0ABR3FPC5_9AGAR